MDHSKYKEYLQLYNLNELNNNEQMDFENHLLECEECKNELESLSKFQKAVISNKPAEPSDIILDQARMDLIIALRKEILPKQQKSWLQKLLDKIFTQHSLVFTSSTATLIIGLLTGYILFNTPTISNLPDNNKEISLDHFNKKNITVSNIRYLGNDDPEDIEISFNEVKPIRYRGNLNDSIIKELLALALINAENPGLKIRTLSTISESSTNGPILDQKIKSSLIVALRSDKNPGVRLEAISLLKEYPYDSDIRDALLFVLSNDTNSGLRVAAINALSEIKYSGKSIDLNTRNVLDKITNTDNENRFLKVRAANLLEENKN